MNKKIFLLLPFCLTLLPACTSSYTLTLINSNPEAGTIITEGGKFKAGEQVHIQVEPAQGYKVDQWLDNVSGKVSSRSDLIYVMPNRDTELTVYYEYDDFELSYGYSVTADEEHYDFSNADEINSAFEPVSFNIDGEYHYGVHNPKQVTWKDTVTIYDPSISYDSTDYLTYNSISDEDGNILGETSCSFEMPNHDTKIIFNLTSNAYGVLLTCNIPYIQAIFSVSNFSHLSFSGYVDSIYQTQLLYTSLSSESKITYFGCFDTSNGTISNADNYVFDHWLDVETQQVVTTDATLTINQLYSNHHFECVLREV